MRQKKCMKEKTIFISVIMTKFNFIKNLSLVFLLIGLLLVNSCSVSQTSLQVLVPAEISVSQEIKHVGIINRSLPAKRNKFVNILEGFISGETIMGDHIGSEYCLRGLTETLNNSPRFSAVIIQGEGLKGTGTRTFPPPLSWERVVQICKKYRIDALISLETFDSNIDIRIDKRMIKKKVKDKKTKEKIKIKVPRYYAKLYIDVNSGWKIYESHNKYVVDANVYSDRKIWNTVGDTKKESRRKLPLKREAINLAGHFSGIQYGTRISPTWINVSRTYYTKGCPEFTEAFRYIKTGNWEEAVLIWKTVLENSDKKIAGRAAFNIAVAAEVRGDLQEAYRWADSAYTRYGNKAAYRYIRTLSLRIEESKRLDEQLKE